MGRWNVVKMKLKVRSCSWHPPWGLRDGPEGGILPWSHCLQRGGVWTPWCGTGSPGNLASAAAHHPFAPSGILYALAVCTTFLFVLYSFSLSLFFFSFLWPYLQHMEVPGLGTVAAGFDTAAVMQDLSLSCDLHHSSEQRRILNPLSEARD